MAHLDFAFNAVGLYKIPRLMPTGQERNALAGNEKLRCWHSPTVWVSAHRPVCVEVATVMNQVVPFTHLRRSGVFTVPSYSKTPITFCRNFVRVGHNPDTRAG